MIIIDIREIKEYTAIPPLKGALLLPASEFKEWITKLNKDDEYGIICHTNTRSMIMAKIMRNEYNFKNVTYFEKGMSTVTGDTDCEVCNIFKNN